MTKPRKTRKDKGKKRGKRIKNPRLQTGSINMRLIGTSATSAPNLTALAGLVASSRPVFPTFSQDQQLINELRDKEEKIKKQEEKILSTELVIRQQNMPPPPQTRPDVEQGQEEVSPAGQVRRAMGKRIARKEKEIEDLEEVEAKLYVKSKILERKNKQTEEQAKVMEAQNMLMSNELQQKKHQLIEQDKAIDLKRKSFLVEQIYTTTADAGLARIKSQLTGIDWNGKEIAQEKQEEGGLENYRKYLMKQAGLNPALVDSREIKVGERGKGRKDFFYNPEKLDLQQGQEERRFTQANLFVQELEEGDLEEDY